MTPKARANVTYYFVIAVLATGVVTAFIGYGGWDTTPGVFRWVLIASYVGCGVLIFLTNRCPHCRRSIDLRGGGAYCPKCGGWNPRKSGDAPPGPLRT
jgi:hypothetical protein